MQTCLASTGSNLLLAVVIGLVALGLGVVAVRSVRGRRVFVALVILLGLLSVVAVAHTPPAGASCVTPTTSPATTTTLPATTTTSPATTTTAETTLSIDFLGLVQSGAFAPMTLAPNYAWIKVCTSASGTNCVTFDSTDTSVPVTKTLTMPATGSLYINRRGTCWQSLWGSQPRAIQVDNASTSVNGAGPDPYFVLNTADSTTYFQTSHQFSNVDTVYLGASDNC